MGISTMTRETRNFPWRIIFLGFPLGIMFFIDFFQMMVRFLLKSTFDWIFFTIFQFKIKVQTIIMMVIKNNNNNDAIVEKNNKKKIEK